MKKTIVVLVLLVLLTVALTSVVHSAPRGAPGLHGVDGKTFGALVSYAAQNCPAELVAHVRGGSAPCVPE